MKILNQKQKNRIIIKKQLNNKFEDNYIKHDITIICL